MQQPPFQGVPAFAGLLTGHAEQATGIRSVRTDEDSHIGARYELDAIHVVDARAELAGRVPVSFTHDAHASSVGTTVRGSSGNRRMEVRSRD